MKHAFAIMLFLLFCAAANAEPMATTIERYVRTLGVDASDCILSDKNAKYLDRLKNQSGFSGSPVVFGKLGGDTFNYQGKALVGSPIEYYYTDLVFMKKEYEKALVGLYRNLAEMPGKRAEVNEAIGLVKEVARRRGERCDEQAAKARYGREIRAEIEALKRQYAAKAPKAKEYCTVLIDYYLNPTDDNLKKLALRFPTKLNCLTLTHADIDSMCKISNEMSAPLFQKITDLNDILDK